MKTVKLENIQDLKLKAINSLFIKRPDNKRKTFSIIPYYRVDGKKVYESPLSIFELDLINEQLVQGKITPINADKRVSEIKQRIDDYIKGLSVDTSLGINLEIAEKFINQKEIQSKGTNGSDRSYRSSMLKAVKMLGKKSLITSSIIDLQKEFDKNFQATDGTPALHKNLTNRINTLLKTIGRGERLKGMVKEPRDVKHLTLKEVEKLKLSFKDNRDVQVMITIGAYCGLRIGEIYGLTKKSIIGEDVIYVYQQKRERPDVKTGKLWDLPKNRKRRKTIIIKGGNESVIEFIKKGHEHYEYLRDDIASMIRTECLKLWPNNYDKHLNDFHDLRDVFAIHLVSGGSPIDSVAKLMGNSPQVCLENYQGFIVSDREVDLVRSIINK